MSIILTRLNQKLIDLLIAYALLCVAMELLRLPELLHQTNAHDAWLDVLGSILVNDVLTILQGMAIWGLLASPSLALTNPSARRFLMVGVSTLVLAVEASLIHYYQVAGVPLGADLFSYSLREMLTISSGTVSSVSLSLWAAFVAGLCINWSWPILSRHEILPLPQARWPLIALVVSTASLLVLPTHTVASEDAKKISLQRKIVFFVEDNFHKYSPFAKFNANGRSEEYPFSHAETTPDTLGPLFSLNTEQKPHFVFIIVEGLGRNFSGPSARLGSFTPFLDSLANKSLYWENFLATQGRTFAVLPSIFGSLPFGSYEHGLPQHHSLLSLLKKEGYALQYFSGSNLDFDQQGQFLAMEGVDSFVSESDFAPTLKKASEWGFADLDLMKKVSANANNQKTVPTVTIVQTMSMHTPFNFPEIDAYRKKVDIHLSVLNISDQLKESYTKQRDIYASILYTDDSLRHYFSALEKLPNWRNTIVVITGDHRLPEIPMQTRIERYHVPLLIASPMIKEPKKIKSVSSHFDIAPSILAMMSNRYEMKMPSLVSWMGTGLDVQEDFRSLHRVPIKQTKTELSDYVSGQYYLGQQQLYKLLDGLQIESIEDLQIKNTLISEFNKFQSGIGALNQSKNLTPVQGISDWVSYDKSERTLVPGAPLVEYQGVSVSGTQAIVKDDGFLYVHATYKYSGSHQSPTFVPLFVMTNEEGKELAESYGSAVLLQPGEIKEVDIKLKLADKVLIHGQYFVAAIVSNPDNGKSIGQGQYRVPIVK